MSIVLDKGKISINLDNYVKQYFINASFEYLLAAVHYLVQENPASDLEIIATCQTPLSLEPFAAIINTLARISQLPPSRITVKTRNRSLENPMATIKVLQDEDFFNHPKEVVTEIEKLKFVYDSDPKLFGALFGRCSFPRLDLAYYLDTFHHDCSLVIFHSTQKHVLDCTWGMEPLFSAQLDWMKTWQNQCATILPDCERGTVNFPGSVRAWPALWGRYFIEIVVETDYHNCWDWTEKTWKCLSSGKPFIHMSGQYSLNEMRHLGFKTFDPWIDESYNREENAWRRLDLIKKEVARLASLDQSMKQATITALLEIADYNRTRAREMYV